MSAVDLMWLMQDTYAYLIFDKVRHHVPSTYTWRMLHVRTRAFTPTMEAHRRGEHPLWAP